MATSSVNEHMNPTVDGLRSQCLPSFLRTLANQNRILENNALPNDPRCQENEIGIETIETAMTLTTNLTPTQCFQKLLPVQN